MTTELDRRPSAGDGAFGAAPPGSPWPAPVRFAVYGITAGVLAVVLTAIAFWAPCSGTGVASETRVTWRSAGTVVSSLRQEYLAAGGPGRWLADLVCVLPWVIAAFACSRRLAATRARPRGVRGVLAVSGAVVVCTLAGQALRVAIADGEGGARWWLACSVAFLPPLLAFSPAVLVLGRLKAGGFGTLGLLLAATLMARLAVPALFLTEPIIDAVRKQILIFPPTAERRVDLFTPMLALWGIFTALEMRIDAARRRPPPGGP